MSSGKHFHNVLCLSEAKGMDIIMKLDNFIGMMTGHFDNKEQFNMMQATGKIYPYAKHVNTVCNDKINNIPKISMGNLLLKKVTMRPMVNVMRHRTFSLLRKMKMEFYFPPMRFRKEKTKIHFHMIL